MRAKVDANSDAVSLNNSALRDMRENSQEAIRKIGLNLVTLYKDPARRDELVAKYASVFKRAVSEIESDRTKVEQIIKMGPPELSEQLAVLMREAKPMIDEVKRGVSDFASQVVGSTAQDASKAFSSISAAVPIVGAVVALGASLYGMIEKQRAEGAERATAGCNSVLKDGNDYLNATIERGFPFPWHALEWVATTNPCGGLTEDDQFKVSPWPVQGFRAAMYNNLVRLYCLPLEAQQDVIRWWAHATAMMTHGEVARIFAALGDDHTFGGMLASDEQVLLVAAPIAVANGLDPYAFAAALWDRSKGWSESPEMLRREEMIRAGDEASTFWPSLASSFEDPRIGQYSDPCLMVQPNNAMQVQWAVLARDAFKLVEDFKIGAVTVNEQILLAVRPGESPIGETFLLTGTAPTSLLTSEGLKHAAVPLAIGAASSGVLVLAGAGLFAASAPIGVALLWVLMSGRSKTASSTALASSAVSAALASDAAVPPGEFIMVAAPEAPPPGEFMMMAPRTGRVSRKAPILALAKRGQTQVRVGQLGTAGAFAEAGDRGLCPYDLHHADASRYKCWEELLALEDHVVGDPCKECMSKHVGAAIKFLREARSLDDGSETDLDDARRIAAIRPKLSDSLDALRALRKSIGERIHVRALLEPSGHEDVDCGCGDDHHDHHDHKEAAS
jgi:hypothetical protein